MSKFVPRLTAAGIYQNKYWYSENPFATTGYGLPNCTCYAWGRACEVMGKIKKDLPMGNAGDWYANAQNTGIYKTGKEPKLGAIVCYGKSGASGHVAVVEEIKANGDFTISQSGYYRPVASYPPDTKNYFWTNLCDGATKKAPWMGSYYFQGFIYIPTGTEPPVPPPPRDWISKNAYLNAKEKENNARIIWKRLRAAGWTEKAVAATLGNMQGESSINPGIWEGLKPNVGGYGLVQWTPASKLFNWIDKYHPGTPYGDGDVQLKRILYELANGIQWDTTNGPYPDVPPPYNMEFAEFVKSTGNLRTLTGAWMLCYEKPGDQSEAKISERYEFAKHWYDLLGGSPIVGDIPIWMLFKFRKKGRF